jgi:hypothetical protein
MRIQEIEVHVEIVNRIADLSNAQSESITTASEGQNLMLLDNRNIRLLYDSVGYQG